MVNKALCRARALIGWNRVTCRTRVACAFIKRVGGAQESERVLEGARSVSWKFFNYNLIKHLKGFYFFPTSATVIAKFGKEGREGKDSGRLWEIRISVLCFGGN